jgi:hypothetical protein
MVKLSSSMEAALSNPLADSSIIAVFPSAAEICTPLNNRFYQAVHILRTLCDQIALKQVNISMAKISSVGPFSHLLTIAFQRESSPEAM